MNHLLFRVICVNICLSLMSCLLVVWFINCHIRIEISIKNIFRIQKNGYFEQIIQPKSRFIRKKSNKWACFINSTDYEEKIKPYFEPRDLRLFSCLFNIDPFEINQTEILVIGSKKKVGSILVDLFKRNGIKYGRIKNRYHFNMTNVNVSNVMTFMNFKTVIDLSNDVKINSIITKLFSTQKVNFIRTFSKTNSTNEIDQYDGVTIITDKIFNPIFYPNAMHTRETGDLNYYIFDKYFLNGLQNRKVNRNEPIYIKTQKYSSAKEIANEIYNLVIKKESENQDKIIDLRSRSKTADEIIQKFGQKTTDADPFEYSISEITSHYKESIESSIITQETDYVYTSHVTIVSNNRGVVRRYKTACQIVNDAIQSFYGMLSVEFICVTDIQPDEYSKFEWLNKLKELKKHHILISVPNHIINLIKKRYNIYYFPEYFLRNIGLRRSRGRYMLSGSSDVIMPPHFFLGIQKHLFSKNYLLRTIRILVKEKSVAETISYSSLFNSFVKNHYFRNKIVNTVFPNPCSMPCNPRNRDCGDFQGFHRNFWYKMNAYYNGHENYNVDSLLDYHLLGMFTPIMYKLMFGEHHVIHPPQSKGTPGIPNTIYCNWVSVKKGIFKRPYDGKPDWGFVNENIPIRYSNGVSF